MSPSSLRPSQVAGAGGFTLVEVLVTLVILGLAVALVTGAVIPATRNADRRTERLSAEREAKSTMEQLLAQDFEDFTPGSLGPSVLSGYPDAQRTMTVAAYGSRVWLVTVEVRVGDEAAELTCLKGRRSP